MLIDSHCHLHDREFFSEKQAEEILNRAHRNDVQKIICIGTSHEDSLAARDFAATHDDVYWTYGVHPGEVDSAKESKKSQLGAFRSPAGRELAREPRGDGRERRGPEWDNFDSKPIAIGEVGLDYHYDGFNREAQIKLFEQMLQLATDNNLPVSFHIREAFEDFFPVVANFPKVRGVVHSFSDNKKNLKRILEQTDFYIGVNGMATYSTLPTPPLERILLETDAPFLAPVPHRGSTNEPGFIPDIARWLGAKLDINFETVANITTENSKNLFAI